MNIANLMTDFLNNIGLFADVESDHLDRVYDASQVHSYQKDEVIFQRGELADALYILQEGQVKLYNSRKGTAKEELVCLIGPGQTFCLAPTLSRESLHINASALVPSKALVIPRQLLEQLIESSHRFAKNVIRYLADKECQMCEEVCSLSLSTTRERLAQYLLREYHRQKPPKPFVLQLSQAELASHLGTVRETLSRDLAALKKSGYIDMTDGTIAILKEPELRQLAGFDELFQIL